MYAPVDEIINFKQQLYQPSKLLKKQYKNFFFRTPNITIPLPQIPNPISSYGLVRLSNLSVHKTCFAKTIPLATTSKQTL